MFNLDDIPETMTDEQEDEYIRNGPVEGIGTWSGMQYVSLPAEEILGKMEETDMGEKRMEPEDMIEYTRDVLREKDIAPPFSAAGETFRDPSAQSFALKLRYPGMEGQSEWPNHSEMFHGFMNDDPSFMQGAPSQAGNALDHTTVRARRMEVSMGDNNYTGITEPVWQNHQISFAKKEMQERSKRILNVWEWPSYINKGGYGTSRVPEAGSSARELQTKYDIAAGSESIGAGSKDARDQYGRIMRNRTGKNWYTLPWIRHGQDLHMESTTQPRGVIAENTGDSISLLYSITELNNEERTGGNRGDRRTMASPMNPLSWTQGMQEMQDEIETRKEGAKARHQDQSLTRRNGEAEFISESKLWNTVRSEHPRGDAVKMKREALVEPRNEMGFTARAAPSGRHTDTSMARGKAVTELEGRESDGYGRMGGGFTAPGDRLGNDMEMTEHWDISDQDIYRDFTRKSGDVPEDLSKARREALMEEETRVEMMGSTRSEGRRFAPGTGRWEGEATADTPVELVEGRGASSSLPAYRLQSRVRNEDNLDIEEHRPFSTSYRTSQNVTPGHRSFDREALQP